MSLVLEFVSCVVKNLVNIPEDVMDGWVQNPKALQKVLTDALCPPAAQKPRLSWQEATQKAYELMGMAEEYADFCKKRKVVDKDGHWTIFMLKGLNCANISKTLKQAGSGFWSYYSNMDKGVAVNDRDPNRDGNYAIAVRSEVEADRENANKSANQLAAEKHQGMTLMERLVLELIYFLATGEHLDVENWTLCSGSRNADGNVPCVDFHSDNGRVKVSNFYSGHSDGDLRSRSVVSLPTEASGA